MATRPLSAENSRPHVPGTEWLLDVAGRHNAVSGHVLALFSCLSHRSQGSEMDPGHSPQGMVLGPPPRPGRGRSCPLLPASLSWEFPRGLSPQ